VPASFQNQLIPTNTTQNEPRAVSTNYLPFRGFTEPGRRSENPRVDGSIPPPGTKVLKKLRLFPPLRLDDLAALVQFGTIGAAGCGNGRRASPGCGWSLRARWGTCCGRARSSAETSPRSPRSASCSCRWLCAGSAVRREARPLDRAGRGGTRPRRRSRPPSPASSGQAGSGAWVSR
jgi:hypothetical protein